MTIAPEQFRAPAQGIVDRHCHYGFCDRCGGSCIPETYDCSGMQCKCCNVAHNLPYQICTSSFVMSQMCWDAGLYMTAAQAEADSGPDIFWAVHGDNFGRTSNGTANGADGHIVLVVRVRDANGHTTGFYTCEAMGHAYGCVNGTYYGRGWTGRYRIPGVADRPPVTFHPERTMILQQYHYDKTGAGHRIPDAIPAGHADAGRALYPTIGPSADGKGLILKDGASFVGAGKTNYQDDYWPSPLVAQHGPILGVTRLLPQDSTPTILVIRHSDGHQDTHRLT